MMFACVKSDDQASSAASEMKRACQLDVRLLIKEGSITSPKASRQLISIAMNGSASQTYDDLSKALSTNQRK